MDGSSEKKLKITLTALHQWWGNMGDFAWILLGVLLVLGVAFLVVLLRWVLRGGLSKRFYVN